MSLLTAMLAVLTHGPVTIPPAHWQAISVVIDAPGTQVEIDFEVKRGSRVEASLLTAGEAVRFNRGRTVTPACASGFRADAHLRCRVAEPGQYVLLLDNRIESREAALVDLRVAVQPPVDVIVRELPPERKRVVIALSIAFFGAVVLFSARQFLKHG